MPLQLHTTARAVTSDDYAPLETTPLTLTAVYKHGFSTLDNPAVWEMTLTNTADAPWQGVVKMEYRPAVQNPQFWLPGFLYGTNRGDAPIRVDNRYPRLRTGDPEFPASPWWMVRADRLSHPAAFMLDGCRWYGLAAAPYFVRRNGKLKPWQPGAKGEFAQFAGFTCSLENGSVGYTLGYENAPYLFVQSHNIKPRAPMGGNCLTLAAGESVTFPLYTYNIYAVDGPRTLYAALEQIYAQWHTPPRRGASPAQAAALLAGAVARDAWLPDDKNYIGITKEKPDGSYEKNKIFSISWTNGLSAAVPNLLAALRLGDETIRAQSLACIDNIVQNSLDPRCGLPNETWDPDHGWSCRGWWFDGMYTGGHSGYLIGQTLYYILKAYRAEAAHGHDHPDWLAFVQGVVPRLAAARNGDEEYPFTLSEQTGAGLEYDSLGSAWCLAAEAALMQLTGDTADLPAMERSEAHYYDTFVRRAVCYGGPLDTNKTVDSEGVLAYIRAARLLHELTGRAVYLDHLRDALCYEYSFKFCYNVPVQVPPLSRLSWSSCGGSITSVANPHIHPMSCTVADEMIYYLKHRPDAYIESRLKDTVGWSLQTFNTFDREYDYGRAGWMSERFCHCEGLLVQTYPDGSPASTWFALMPWACGSVLEGLCGDWWDYLKEEAVRNI
ncbi:hypothetical protein [Gemmiger sp.]